MSKTIKEPEELVKINNSIRKYGGLYAKWKSSNFTGGMPEELLPRLVELQINLDHYLINYKEDEKYG